MERWRIEYYQNGGAPPVYGFDQKKYHREYQRTEKSKATRREWLKKNPHYKREKQRLYRKQGKDKWLNEKREFSRLASIGFLSYWP